jgi:hypothetical protein
MVQGQAGELALLAAWFAVDGDGHWYRLILVLLGLDPATGSVDPVGGVFVLCPAGHDAGAEHLVKQPGQVVVGVTGESGLHVV